MITETNFNIMSWVWIAFAIILFPILLKVTQPYGRHTKGTWGPMINNRLGWFLMELPALLVFYWLLKPLNIQSNMVLVAGILWGVHYMHRAIIYPLTIKTKGKKMPLLIMLFAVLFNSVNGFLNGYWLAYFAPINKIGFLENLHVWMGLIIFIIGFGINKYHDALLIKLRNSEGTGYKIPHGGLFSYVSCPNFLGEIISWLGFFIVTLSVPALSFLMWGMVNLVTRALDHHKWYSSHFDDYPPGRKAIFPFLL